MWQRIQTVFLAIAIISLLASIFMPIWFHQDPAGEVHTLYALHFKTETPGSNAMVTSTVFPYCITAVFAIASITIALIAIRKFKDRVLQMKLGALNSLFMAGTIACAVIFSNQLTKTYNGGVYGLGLWLPGLAVLCNLLANRFIRRDEKLVRDSNRLR